MMVRRKPKYSKETFPIETLFNKQYINYNGNKTSLLQGRQSIQIPFYDIMLNVEFFS
jgi:hypothetical protein